MTLARFARLFRAVGIISLLVTAFTATTARADWQAGGHQELTAQLVCQDIANDFTGFHPATICHLLQITIVVVF